MQRPRGLAYRKLHNCFHVYMECIGKKVPICSDLNDINDLRMNNDVDIPAGL